MKLAIKFIGGVLLWGVTSLIFLFCLYGAVFWFNPLGKIFPYLVILCWAPAILYSTSYDKWREVLGITVASLWLVVMLLSGIDEDKKYRHHQRYGNVAPPFQQIFYRPTMQRSLRWFTAKLSLCQQYAWISLEDINRIQLIQELGVSSCLAQSPLECFEHHFRRSQRMAPFTITGLIMSLTYQSKLIWGDAEMNLLEKGLKIKSMLSYHQKIKKAKKNQVGQILVDFPEDKLALMPQNLKTHLARIDLDKEFRWSMLWSEESWNKLMLRHRDFGMREQQAYLILRFEEKIGALLGP